MSEQLLTVYPEKYLRYNDQQTKQLNIVVQIEGLPDLIATNPVYTTIRYGDEGIKYGDTGLVYGGLRALENVRTGLSLDSALQLSQKLEPEQGRSSISTLSLVMIDPVDAYFTKLISPGGHLDELLGSKEVKVWIGHQQTSWPQDYFIWFRGICTGSSIVNNKVTVKLSDANFRRKQKICRKALARLDAGITDVQTLIPLSNAGGFFDHVADPDGEFDNVTTRTWIKVENEFMEYGPEDIDFDADTITVQRGGSNSRGTTAVAHAIDSEVTNVIELFGNPIELALKVMLSGWAGPWKEDVPCLTLGTALDPELLASTNVILLQVIDDAQRDFGLVPGDWVNVSGSSFGGNNGWTKITELAEGLGEPNRLLYVEKEFTPENPATGVTLAFRSKYDTLPTAAGLNLRPPYVDIERHELTRARYFSTSENRLRIFIQEEKTGKEFIESELYLPVRAYSLTRYGRLSVGYTRPPIPEDQLVILDETNIVAPETIEVSRALNDRRFFNEIGYEYDAADDGHFRRIIRSLDTESLSKTEQSSVLPIKAGGVRQDLGGELLVTRVSRHLLSRYKNGAFTIKLQVTWGVGSLLESGDVVVIRDEGTLQIPNLQKATRDLEVALFEVIDRQADPKTGRVTLLLLSGLEFNLTDRYATWSPSSLINAAESTTTRIKVKASFGQIYGAKEYLKWREYIGLPILVHDRTWTQQAQATFIGFDDVDPFLLLLDPLTPLPWVPGEDDILEIAPYPDTTDPKENQLYKLVHLFFTPTLTVVTGVSQTEFTVSAPDAARAVVGQPIKVRNSDWSISSVESIVADVTGTTITVETALGFVPAVGQYVELVGFRDGGGPYRWL